MTFGAEIYGPDGTTRLLNNTKMYEYLGRYVGTASFNELYSHYFDVTSAVRPLVLAELPENSVNTGNLDSTIGAGIVLIKNIGGTTWRVYMSVPYFSRAAAPAAHVWVPLTAPSADTWGMRIWSEAGDLEFDAGIMGLHIEARHSFIYGKCWNGSAVAFQNYTTGIAWAYQDVLTNAFTPGFCVLIITDTIAKVHVYRVLCSFYRPTDSLVYIQRFWVLTYTNDEATRHTYNAHNAYSTEATRQHILSRKALYD